jgi:hypothetical protein
MYVTSLCRKDPSKLRQRDTSPPAGGQVQCQRPLKGKKYQTRTLGRLPKEKNTVNILREGGS